MHGTEHRIRKRRTLRLSAPRSLVLPAKGSKPSSAPQLCLFRTGPDARNDLSLARNECPVGTSIAGSTLPACYFAFSADQPFCPFDPSAPRPVPVRPGSGRFNASGPLQNCRPTSSVALPASTPLRDSYIPPDQSVPPNPQPLGPPSESARFPLAPRSRFYF